MVDIRKLGTATTVQGVRQSPSLAGAQVRGRVDAAALVARDALDGGQARVEERGPLMVVHVQCDLDENKHRIQSTERGLRRKPRDPAMAERNHARGARLSGGDAAHLLRLHVTSLSEGDAARAIQGWLNGAVVPQS